MHYFIILDDDCSHNNFMSRKLDLIIQKLKLKATIELNTTSPRQVLEYSARNKTRSNIYLLDVNVQDKITGIDVAGMIRSQEAGAYIVFVSAYPEYVLPCLKTKIFDYLIKPVTIEMLESCISAIVRDYTRLSKKSRVPALSIKSGCEVYNLPMDEIVYMEKFRHVLVMHTVTGRFEFTETLESIEYKLDKNKFYRCHKSYIVNLTYISRIDYSTNIIYLKNGADCPVSKRNKKELKLLCCQ